MENTSYEKFENLLNENNVTAYKVAKNTGLGFSFFTKWKQGKTTPKLVTLQKIADYFGVSVSYFTGEETNIVLPPIKEPEKLTTLPIIGEIRAGFPTLAQENIIGYEEIPLTWLCSGEYFVLQVVGDSMVDARIMPGDKVLVRVQSDCENGQIAVITIDDIEPVATLKRVFFNGDKVELVPENRKYPRMVYDANQITIRGIVKKVIFDV